MFRNFISKYWRDIIILVPVILCAAYFRFNDIRMHQVFLGDQGRDVLIVKRMIVDGDLTFIGPNASVGGFFLGPLYYYLMIPPLMLAKLDPVGPAIMVAFFSLVTTVLIYFYMKRYVSIAGALVSSAIYAVSTLVVEYARSSWNPNVQPFFVMVLIIAWTKILARDTRHYLIWYVIIGVMLGSLVQLHYASIIMVIVSAALYLWHILIDWSQHNKLRIKQYVAETICMVLGAIIILLPFLGFEIKNSYPNTRGIITFVFQGRDDGFSGGAPFEFIVRDVTNRLFLRLVSGGDAVVFDFNVVRAISPLTLVNSTTVENDFLLITIHDIVVCILVVGILYGMYRLAALLIIYVRNTDKRMTVRSYLRGFIAELSYQKYIALFLVFSTWWIFGVGWWGFYKKSIYDYYFSYMYPLPILLFGVACALLFHMYSRRLVKANITIRIGKIILWGFIGLVITTNILRLKTIYPGIQVQRAEWAADAIIKMLGEGAYNFALVADGNSDHAYRYFLEVKGYRPVPIDKSVTDQLIVLCEIDISKKACEPEGHPLWEIAGFGPAKIVGQSTAIGYPLYRLQHIEGEEWRIGLPAQKGD